MKFFQSLINYLSKSNLGTILRIYGIPISIFIACLILSIGAFRFILIKHVDWNPIEVYILGILLSCLTVAYAFFLIGRRISIEKEIQERTTELVIINRILQQEIQDRHNAEQALLENEKRLIDAMGEAKAANESKNEFLATISHELRTPLNAIIGFNQCLLMEMDGPINEEQQISLEKIEKSSLHLLNLINDILDWTKIEAHRMELEIKSYNIVDIVKSCMDEMQSFAHQKGLKVNLSFPYAHMILKIDKVRMRQVLLNLLSNAIKFTKQGSITVTLLNEPLDIIIHVNDTGIGLHPKEIAKIFQPFSQADSSITRKYGGTGLGLIISKKIIELHGGTISVESTKGKGSTFTIKLPKGNKPL